MSRLDSLTADIKSAPKKNWCLHMFICRFSCLDGDAADFVAGQVRCTPVNGRCHKCLGSKKFYNQLIEELNQCLN